MVATSNASPPKQVIRHYSSNPDSTTGDEIEAIITRSRKVDGEPSKSNYNPEPTKESSQPGQDGELHGNERGQCPDGHAKFGTKATDEAANSTKMQDSLDDETVFASRRSKRIPEGFKHDLLHQHDLGVDSLGKRVEALVIKNPNRMKMTRKSAPLIAEESVMPAANLRWQDMMPKPSDGEEDSSTEVMTNIEELRPTETDVISETDFRSTMDVLQNGFTSSQLVWYISKNQEAIAQVDDEPSYPCILRQTRWESASKDALDRMKPKQQLALSIMRSVWKLYKHDEVEGLGRVKVWLPSNTLRLLAREYTFFFLLKAINCHG